MYNYVFLNVKVYNSDNVYKLDYKFVTCIQLFFFFFNCYELIRHLQVNLL